MRRKQAPFKRWSAIQLLIGAAGAALGAAIILFGYPFRDHPASQAFIRQPAFLVWFFLIMFTTALAALLSGPLWSSLNPYKEQWKRSWLDTIVSLIVIILMLRLISYVYRSISPLPPPPLQHHSVKITVVTLLAFLAIAPALIGTWLIRASVLSEYIDAKLPTASKRQAALVRRYLEHRDLAQYYLTVLGTITGLVTLDTGALRNVQIAMGVAETDYPLILVLVYGLYYTMLIVLIYGPTHFTLLQAGKRLRDHLCPMDSIEDLYQSSSKRAQLDKVLQLKTTTGQSLATGIAILGPLLTSLFSAVLDLKV